MDANTIMASPPRASEHGVTLIELLVALMVLGMVLAGIVAGAISAMRVTQINDQRAVATNIAQAEIERLRTLPFSDLTELVGATERTEETSRGDYFVLREVTWTSLDIDADPCLAPVDGEVGLDAVRVDVRVSPTAAPDRVSSTSTIVSRPWVSEDEETGVIAVRVQTDDLPPEPVRDVLVTLTHQGGSVLPSQVSPTSGCVLFAGLPAGENYSAKIEKPGYVDPFGVAAPATAFDLGVTAGSRTSTSFLYEPAAELLVVPEDDTAEILLPETLPVTISRGAGAVTRQGTVDEPLSGLWPGSWSYWAGDCPAADPQGRDGDNDPIWPDAPTRQMVGLEAAALTTTGVNLAVLSVELPPSIEPYSLHAEAMGGCDAGTAHLNFADEVPGGSEVLIGLPYGMWRLAFTTSSYHETYADVELDPRLAWEDGPIAIGELAPPPVTGPLALPTGGEVSTIVDPGTGALYRVHAFVEDGSLTLPTGLLDIDYLVVGGGGAGGGVAAGDAAGGGGGGAGAVVTGSQLLVAGSHDVVIGAGGEGEPGGAAAANGASSALGTFATAPGGGGGATGQHAASAGGSGGGGSRGHELAGDAISGQGHVGGAGHLTWMTGAGGGGAGGAGHPSDVDGGGAGGAGVLLPLLSDFSFAGGGGGGGYEDSPGGTAGAGGGGSASVIGRAAGADGAPNTGSGGAGATGSSDGPSLRGGHGGTGIVVVWYPVEAP